MKKRYIILSILLVVIITFGVLSGVFFVRYKDITEEIVGKEVSYSFTGFIPILQPKENGEGYEIVQQERPDTSALKADSNVALGLAITFLVIGCIALIGFVIYLIFTIKKKKLLDIKDTTPPLEE